MLLLLFWMERNRRTAASGPHGRSNISLPRVCFGLPTKGDGDRVFCFFNGRF